MTFRVNGSVFSDQNLTGSLRHFAITGGDFTHYVAGEGGKTVTYPLGFSVDQPGSETVFFDEGEAIPQSAAEMVYEAVSTAATVVQLNVDSDGVLYFALENSSAGWLKRLNWDTKGGVPQDQTANDFGDGTTGEAVGVIKKILEDAQERFIASREALGVEGTASVGIGSVSPVGAVLTVTINDGGTGFNLNDPLEISSPASGDAGGFSAEVDTITDGIVTSISIDSAGTGYQVGDPLEAAGAASGTGLVAEVATIGGSGEVTGITISDGGQDYSNGDGVVGAAGANGTGFAGSVDGLDNGVIASINVTDAGHGYQASDAISGASGASGSGLDAVVATVDDASDSVDLTAVDVIELPYVLDANNSDVIASTS